MSTSDNTRLIEVYAGNILEAGMVKSMLEGADIHAYLKNEIMGTMTPWLSTPGGAGSVKVLVHDTDADAAKDIVAEYENNIPGMTRSELLNELQNEMLIALQPSATHGIGVFAIAPIPKGCRHIFSKDTGGWIKISINEAAQLPAHSRNFIETYYLYDNDHYYIPDHGTKIMDMANYLNHSSTPNLVSVEEGKWFEALRDIAVGEELFIDYGTIADGLTGYQD